MLIMQQQSTIKVWLDEVNGSNAERNVVWVFCAIRPKVDSRLCWKAHIMSIA